MFDYLIRNGWLVDGTGNPRYRADVAITGDRIAAIGQLAAAGARKVIDARGKIVCPGFIDAHSHTDSTILMNPTAESTIRQGITTEIVGNCGNCRALEAPAPTPAPASTPSPALAPAPAAAEKSRFGTFLDQLAQEGTSCNLAWLAGHNSIRKAAGVTGSTSTAEQMAQMKDILCRALDEGALGLSTGLEFEPGRSASTEEIIQLAKVLRRTDGIYASHIRNRDASVLAALAEFMEIVRTCGVRGQVSHMNIRHNTGAPEGAWQSCVEMIAAARAEGLEVLADMTPLNYGMGMLAAILPPWLRREGNANAVRILRDPQIRAQLRHDCDRYWRFIHRGEWERVYMQDNPAYPELNGLSLPEIAARWGKDPWECCFDILAAAGEQMDSVSLIARLFTDEHLRETISHPLYMLVVDGYSTRIDGPLAKLSPFPLHFMGMAYFLTHHVREKNTLSLEEAIRKMTSMPATHFRLKDRGLLRKGHFADIVVFDFDHLTAPLNFGQPPAYVTGVEYVFVNGQAVMDNGKHTGARPGRHLV
ncbi:MAG TPA: D-aminoacylase [Firmicutes bacterium]|nr:D-aminoacylase [Bacillota bacterium]